MTLKCADGTCVAQEAFDLANERDQLRDELKALRNIKAERIGVEAALQGMCNGYKSRIEKMENTITQLRTALKNLVSAIDDGVPSPEHAMNNAVVILSTLVIQEAMDNTGVTK